MLTDFISKHCMLAGFKASSKKQLLQGLSDCLAEETGDNARRIFDALLAREKLGTTGFGKGVAIPHARLEGLKRITGLFARLDTPVDFDSLDEKPVDLVFVLLAPEDAGTEHLQALSRVSRLLRREEIVEALRAAESPDDITNIISPSLSAAA